jgi:hypothetical protein
MVHFDTDVIRSYLGDTRRVLAPGLGGSSATPNYTSGHDRRTNPQARNFMTEEMFAHYALKEGLNVLSQRVIDWSDEPRIDCWTIVERTG